jgi:DNA-directed RNA polymerase III subunit RPC1
MNSAALDDGNTAPSSSSTTKYLVKEDLAPKQISHIQSGVLSPSQMQRLAEFQVCSRELFRMPLRTQACGGCLDPRLGVSDKSATCAMR